MVIVNERNEVPTISAISCQILTFYHFRAPLLFSDPVLQCTFFSNVHLAMRTFFKVCLLAATTIVVATSFIKLSSKKCAFRNQFIVSVVCTQAVPIYAGGSQLVCRAASFGALEKSCRCRQFLNLNLTASI